MKKILLFLVAVFCVLPLLPKEYADYLADAKKYEEQEKWCFALGSYYDALETDEVPEKKKEACEGYAKLRDAIKAGKPGFSKYDEFTVNDEWKKLVIDAEKYFSSICCVDITEISIVRDSVQLNYKTKSKEMTYGVNIKWKEGHRYKTIKSIVVQGLNTMISFYKGEYSNFEVFDGAGGWPTEGSASYTYNNVYNIDGALVCDGPYGCNNAFCCLRTNFTPIYGGMDGERVGFSYDSYGAYDFLVNIVDENRNVLVEGRKWLLDTWTEAERDSYCLVFSGITPAVADLIDSGKACVNIEACYLMYGKYNPDDYLGGERTFKNNLSEVQIPMSKSVIGERVYLNFSSLDEFVDWVLK